MSTESINVSLNDNSPLLGRSRSQSPTARLAKSGLTCEVLLAIVACTLGSSFQFGYGNGVINTPQQVITNWINESYARGNNHEYPSSSTLTFIWSTIVSVFNVGGMIGALLSGLMADRCGRRGALLYNNIWALVAALTMALTMHFDTYWLLIIGRFLYGVNAGLASGLAPLYLSEISPAHLRGAIGSLPQLVITIGVLVAQALGMNVILGTDELWPILFVVPVLPAIFQLCTLWRCVESPQYTLVVKHDEHTAEKDLRRLRGATVDISNELNAIRSNAESAHRDQAPKSMLIRDPLLRWSLFIALMMTVSQQLSGINVAIFYSTKIFTDAGLVGLEAQAATLGMGALLIAMTFVSVLIIDLFGRRVLHIAGMTGMFFCSILLVVFLVLQSNACAWCGYVSVVFLLLFVISFATGPGSIPWFFATELFTDEWRAAANSIAACLNWFSSFLIGLLFLPFQTIAGAYSMLFFTVCLLGFILFTYFFVPETRGRSMHEIQETLRNKGI